MPPVGWPSVDAMPASFSARLPARSRSRSFRPVGMNLDLSSARSSRACAADTVGRRSVEVVSHLMVGLSMFKWDGLTRRWKVKTGNIMTVNRMIFLHFESKRKQEIFAFPNPLLAERRNLGYLASRSSVDVICSREEVATARRFS